MVKATSSSVQVMLRFFALTVMRRKMAERDLSLLEVASSLPR
jgi:hypothetical protein